jgi:hypothetical protein
MGKMGSCAFAQLRLAVPNGVPDRTLQGMAAAAASAEGPGQNCRRYVVDQEKTRARVTWR